MTISKLAKGCIWSPNFTQGRWNVTRLTPHHTAMIGTAEQIAAVFKPTSRNASCNYAIGVDGDIVCVVDEDNRSWCTSSYDNDMQAITFELSDCDYDWNISDATLEAYINLCVDLIQRYPSLGGSYDWTGDMSGNVTIHRWFSATTCCGDPLYDLQDYIMAEVNRRLNGGGRYGVPMECIMRPDGANFLAYVNGNVIIPLTHPDQCIALDKVYNACHGTDMPRIELGEEGAPWAWRFFQGTGNEALYDHLMNGTPMPAQPSQPADVNSEAFKAIGSALSALGDALAKL